MATFEDSNNLFVLGRQFFTIDYEAGRGTLPEEQGWDYIDLTNMPNQPSVIDAKLLQGPTEYDGAQIWEIFPGSIGDFRTDNTVWEVQIKVLKSSDDIAVPSRWHTGWEINIVDSNKRGFALGLSESGVRLSDDLATPMHQLNKSIEIPFDTTDDFHVYRLQISGGTGYVIIDGSGAGNLVFGSAASEQTVDHVWFGDDSNLASGQTELIYVHTDVAYQELHQDSLDLYTKSTATLSASGNLITLGAQPLSASGNLVIPNIFDVLQSFSTLKIEGHQTAQSSGTLSTIGHEAVSSGVDLVMPNIFDVLQSSGTLWVQGIILSSGNLNFAIPETKAAITSDISLFMSPFITSSGDIDLYLNGVILVPSPSIENIEGIFIDEYCRTNDFIPTLVGEFTRTSPSGVTIIVWDIIDGDNTVLVLTDNTAQQIGNTKSWMWSMINMPSDKSADGHFFFTMTADTGEMIDKEVIIRTSSDGTWKYP
ncbi:hypothetical protein LCGC14_1646260 [marine sediment metagenome]|uniref:Uncharacterized protein n=1 Tax=marine sediment metagenome TaxID=412755 RepID=A0A0F9KY33_9ZZZZ